MNVNKKNDTGRASIHYACSKGYTEIVQLLLANGGKVNLKDRFGGTPLHRACLTNKHSPESK